MRHSRFFDPCALLLPLDGGLPKGVSLYRSLRALFEGVRLSEGQRLPSSRRLAADLGVSRTTTEGVYGRLEAEGYLVRRRGSGSYVGRTGVGGRARRQAAPRAPRGASTVECFSARGRTAIEAARSLPAPSRRIDPCTAEEELIPSAALSRLLARALLESPLGSFRDLDPLGLPALRGALARHLFAERGIDCVPEQVVITSGTQHSLSLLASLLLDAGDPVAFEEPGYPEARAAFRAAGARLLPVSVDGEGMGMRALARLSAVPRLIYLTPSHQYPLGFEMSPERRRFLLRYAGKQGASIVEDDYDSELRFEGPLERALASEQTDCTVFYCGTFNKVLFSSLRLAYLVIPKGLSKSFESIRRISDGGEGFPMQAALAAYLESGAYAAHLHAARRTFRARRDLLVDRLAPLTRAGLTMGPHSAGLHLCLRVPPESNIKSIVTDKLSVQIGIRALSDYFMKRSHGRPGLVIGYGRLDEERIEGLVRLLARSLP